MSNRKEEAMTIKRWIELPPALVEKISKIAEREHRTEKGQIEHMIVEHVREIERTEPRPIAVSK